MDISGVMVMRPGSHIAYDSNEGSNLEEYGEPVYNHDKTKLERRKRPIYGEVLSFQLFIDGVEVIDPVPDPVNDGIMVRNNEAIIAGDTNQMRKPGLYKICSCSHKV